MAKQPKSYTAPHPVQADGQYYKPNRVFTTAAPKGEQWEEVGAAERAAADAADKIPPHQPLPESQAALEAIAFEKNVNTTGLKGKQLKNAIGAANEPKL